VAIVHRLEDDDDKLVVIPEDLDIKDTEIEKRWIFRKNGQVYFEFIDYYKPTKLNLIEIEGPNNKIIQTLIDELGDEVKVVGEEIFSVFDKKRLKKP